MINELFQKKGFNYRKHIIFDDKIVVEYKNFNQIIKYEIKIDQIGFNLQYEKSNHLFAKIYFWFFVSMPLIYLLICYFKSIEIELSALFSGIGLSLIFIITNYFNKPKDDIFLVGNQKNLVFYRNIPNEKLVLEFIEEIISTSRKYLKLKYTVIEKYMTEDEFSATLRWLLEKDIINRIEFENLIQDFKIKQLL
jgi:hypothetical protein